MENPGRQVSQDLGSVFERTHAKQPAQTILAFRHGRAQLSHELCSGGARQQEEAFALRLEQIRATHNFSGKDQRTEPRFDSLTVWNTVI